MMNNKTRNDMTPSKFFMRNRIGAGTFILILAVLAYMSAELLGFEFSVILKNMDVAWSNFTQSYLPADFSEGGMLFKQMLVTVMLAIASGLVGSILAYIVGLMTSYKTRFSLVVAHIARFISTFMRNIPSSIWAMILLISFWHGDFLAFIVMTISSFGFNARVFANTFDEASAGNIEALNAVGASKIQIIAQAVTPESLPQLVSWTLYSIETNLRDSTIIGMLTGGGIGYYVDYFRQFRRFDELTAAVVFIVLAVLVFDRLTVMVNEELLS